MNRRAFTKSLLMAIAVTGSGLRLAEARVTPAGMPEPERIAERIEQINKAMGLHESGLRRIPDGGYIAQIHPIEHWIYEQNAYDQSVRA